MKILVTFALENEFAPWRKRRNFKLDDVNAWGKAYRARISDADVRVILTGAGRFTTERALARAFDELPDVCIASGLAGGLNGAYRPGQLVAARTVGDVNGTQLISCDALLVSLASASGATIAGKILVSGKVIATAEEKRKLGASGDAVDMESFYVLEAAARRRVRSVAIRSISDSVESSLPLDFDRVFDRQGTVSISKVVGQLVARPRRIAGVLRLARASERAAAALADFLDMYIEALSHQPLAETAIAEAMAI